MARAAPRPDLPTCPTQARTNTVKVVLTVNRALQVSGGATVAPANPFLPCQVQVGYGDPVEVILGGVVTLAATFLIQVFVIPQVQARIRNRERWETDIIELLALVEEEIPRAHSLMRSGGYALRYMSEWTRRDDVDRERLEEMIASTTSEFRRARELGDELIARLSRLERRIRRINSDAPHWRRLALARMSLTIALFDVERDALPGEKLLEDQEWESAWRKVRDAREELTKSVRTVADPMKPPPDYPMRRMRRRIAGWVLRLRNRHTQSKYVPFPKRSHRGS